MMLRSSWLLDASLSCVYPPLVLLLLPENESKEEMVETDERVGFRSPSNGDLADDLPDGSPISLRLHALSLSTLSMNAGIDM